MDWRGLLIPVIAALGAGAWLAPEFVRLPRGPSVGYLPRGEPSWNHPASSVVPDDRPAFQIDPSKPWRIDLGRGSGMYGLETVTLDQTGRVVICQQTEDREGKVIVVGWETAEDRISPEAVAAVLAAVASNRLTELHREYAANVCDGSQWILRIRQGEHEKAVYFNNHFPDAVVRFATQLDEIVATDVGARLRWRPALAAGRPDTQDDLWESIRR